MSRALSSAVMLNSFQHPCAAIDVARAVGRLAWMLKQVQHDDDPGVGA
jgi:D-serine deaminase-like pyridoxal phosphate-dependent protein